MGEKEETGIVRQIKTYLKMSGFLVIRINQGGIKNDRGQWHWYASWTAAGMTERNKGICDLLAVSRDGVHVWIEVKVPGEEQREEQKEFESQLVRRGVLHLVAECVEDVQDFCQAYVYRG